MVIIYILDCKIDGRKVIYCNSIVFMKNLKDINLKCKYKNKIDNYDLGDVGCKTIFNNSKYLLNLEKLNLQCNKE